MGPTKSIGVCIKATSRADPLSEWLGRAYGNKDIQLNLGQPPCQAIHELKIHSHRWTPFTGSEFSYNSCEKLRIEKYRLEAFFCFFAWHVSLPSSVSSWLSSLVPFWWLLAETLIDLNSFACKVIPNKVRARSRESQLWAKNGTYNLE